MTFDATEWAHVRLSDLLNGIKAGKNLKCEERPPTSREKGVVKVSAVTWGTFDASQSKTLPANFVPDQDTLIRAGDLLFSRANTIELVGAVVIVDRDHDNLYLSDKILRLDVDAELKAWLLKFLRSPDGRKALGAASSGNQHSMRNIGQAALGEIEIPLPPLPEQRRIVAKLDRLSARSAAARDHLARTAKLAARAKQAILAAAFRGEITADWRGSKCSAASEADRTASALESERAELLAATAARRKGKAAQDDHHRIGLELELPKEWRMTTMEAASSPVRLIQYGILKPGPDMRGGVPYVKVMNIKGGCVELDKIRHTTSEIHLEYRRSSLKTGDLLLTIRGTVGRLAFAPDELDGGNITQDTVRIDVLKAMNARFVFWYLHCPAAEQYFRDNQKGVAVRGINVGDVRPMEVPLPGRREQDEIVRRIEAAFARIDRLTAEAARAAHLLDRLDERLLAKAFRGELVPQDPADEPAGALLARIRAARDGAARPRRGRRSGAAS